MKIHLLIATPNNTNFDEEVERVEIKTIEGNITVLHDHIPFISSIKNGYVKFNDNNVEIKEGLVHFKKNVLYITYFE